MIKFDSDHTYAQWSRSVSCLVKGDLYAPVDTHLDMNVVLKT